MSFLMHSCFGFREQRQAEVGLTTYNEMAKESLLALHFKAFAKRKESRLDTLHCMCMRITAQQSDARERWHREKIFYSLTMGFQPNSRLKQ